MATSRMVELRKEQERIEKKRREEGINALTAAEHAVLDLAEILDDIVIHRGDSTTQMEAIAARVSKYLPEGWDESSSDEDESDEDARD